MARKLDSKSIEAKRQKRQANHSDREMRKLEIREAVESHKANPRTYEIPQKSRIVNEIAKKPIVAGYARVSTQEEAQAESFEGQIHHLTEMIQNNPAWEFGGIFSDEGISGTSVAGREGFKQMIAAAIDHKIDMIVTKDMSRFGRNCLEILTNLKLLRNLNPQVGVLFEIPGMSSLDAKNDLLIMILSAIAQLESQQKSESIKQGIRNRMRLGIFKFSVRNTLGYYRDHFGRIKIDMAEADIVRFIYESFLEGASPMDIACMLSSKEIATPKGLYVWRVGTVLGILKNEKYNGNALFQKYIVKDYLSHRTVKNDVIPMIMAENHHPAIISLQDWNKAQELLVNWQQRKSIRQPIENMKIKKDVYFPRVKTGVLKGFYLLDCGWTRVQREQFLHTTILQKK